MFEMNVPTFHETLLKLVMIRWLTGVCQVDNWKRSCSELSVRSCRCRFIKTRKVMWGDLIIKTSAPIESNIETRPLLMYNSVRFACVREIVLVRVKVTSIHRDGQQIFPNAEHDKLRIMVQTFWSCRGGWLFGGSEITRMSSQVHVLALWTTHTALLSADKMSRDVMDVMILLLHSITFIVIH